jgi:hypothetical protein
LLFIVRIFANYTIAIIVSLLFGPPLNLPATPCYGAFRLGILLVVDVLHPRSKRVKAALLTYRDGLVR